MTSTLRFFLFFLFLLAARLGYAQAPNISYTSPQVYTINSAISPLIPVNSGGAVPTPTPVTLALGYNNVTGIAVDISGNVYIAENGYNDVKEIPAGGGSVLTLGSGFIHPTGVAVDATGNVYVVDNGNNAVKEIPVGGGAIITLGSGFNGPYGIAIDAAHNLYVGDANNNEVKKIPVGGAAPIIIGTGFDHPTGVAVDASGNVYVADRGNNEIKKILAAGGSTVILANGEGNPDGVAVDKNGNVYFADTFENSITEIPAAGGSMIAIGSNFNSPTDVAVDAKLNIYIADNGNNAVKEVGYGGFSITAALPAGLNFDTITGIISGTPTAVSAATNYTVTAFNGNDSSVATINITVNLPPKPTISYTSPQVYTALVPISPLSPVSSGGPVQVSGGYSANPVLPAGLALDINTGIISGTPTVASTATNYTITATNIGGSGSAIINITVNSPSKPIVSYSSPQVYTTLVPISPLSPVNSGGAVQVSGGYSINPVLPAGLALDINTGIISGTATAASTATNYTVTATNIGGSGSAIVNITVNPYPVPVISYKTPQVYPITIPITPLAPTSSGVSPVANSSPLIIIAHLSNLKGIAVDASDNLYAVQNGANAVDEILAGGETLTPVGVGFITPTGVAVDAAGNVYVVDYGNNAIKKIPAGGGAITIIGSGFNGPYGIALDVSGNIYIGDANNNEVKKIPAGSNTPVIIGTGFNHPTGVAVDAAGNVYVADRANNAIKKILVSNGTTVSLSNGDGNPNGVAVDSQGNVYFADTEISTITEIPAGGGPNIAAGGGFSNPTDVTVDKQNNIFVSDNGTGDVYEIKLTGGYFISPVLPAGLNFNNSTGIISGTPTANSPATNYTVSAYNIGGSGSAVLNISVTTPNAGLASLAVSSGVLSPVFTTSTTGYSVAEANSTSTITVTPTTSDPTYTVKVNGTQVTSGTPSLLLPLTAGVNTISIVVTSQGGATLGIYTLVANRAPSTNANLASLGIGSGTLNPAFATGTTNYTASVPYSTASITFTPTVADPTATVTVNGTAVASGSVSSPVSLNAGSNTVTVAVTAQDGLTKLSYTITVTRSSPSSNANLASLGISPGILNPAFATGTTNYTTSVPYSTTAITFTPTAADPTASVTINGITIASGSVSSPISLNTGGNAITVAVTAQDGLTKLSYTITVTRSTPSSNANLANLTVTPGILSPTFTSGTANYTLNVNNATTSIIVTPTLADANASINLEDKMVASGSATTFPLSVGVNSIVAIITAQDSTTTQIYRITVNRAPSSDAGLANLTASTGSLSPSFATATTSYTLAEATTQSSITVTPTTSDPTATVTVNDTAVISGIASGAISLSLGSNTINVVVTAQDGTTTETYTITATRTPSTNANLASLVLGNGSLSPAFAANTPNYTTSVPYAATSITVTPAVADATATMTVNGVTLASGITSGALPLSVGTNNILIKVTAQDGVTTQTYTVIVTRANASSNASLANITLSSGTLTPSFATATTSYTASVTNATTFITLTPTTTDATAQLTVNNSAVTSGTASSDISLNVGANTITVVVTAQDGVTKDTYAIMVTRAAPSSIATLSKLTVSSGTLAPAFATGTTSYTDVAHAVTSIAFRAITTDPLATETINGTAVPEGTVSPYIPLSAGVNNISVVVTAADGVTKDTYTIAVTRLPGTATLSKLTVSSGTLTPIFATGTTSYTDVAHSVSSIAFRAITTDPLATETINGTAVPEGTVSPYIPLNVGANNISVVVTAQDGVTQDTYTIAVTRLPNVASLSGLTISSGTLTPAFATATTGYTDNVANTVSSIAFRATTTDHLATETINGTTVPEGTVSPYVPLNAGLNTITIVVTAQDGVTTETYTVTVDRAGAINEDLSALTISNGTLSPAFASSINSYTAIVSNAIATVTLTPATTSPTSAITVNGIAVTSGMASGAVNLNVGANVIPVVVTEQDGVTKNTYTVTITRGPPSSIATLSSFTISNGTLTPVFASGITTYTDVVYSVSSVAVRATTTDPLATETINGIAVPEGTVSAYMPLNVGVNIVSVVVTAQDGVTTEGYQIAVTRMSNIATLSNLTISSGTLTPAFGTATNSYTDDLASSITQAQVQIRAVATDPNAHVSIDGMYDEEEGGISYPIALQAGQNSLPIIVTSADGLATHTYIIVVTVPASNDANLYGLTVSSGTLTPGFATATTNYTDNVANTVSFIAFRSTPGYGATQTINGTSVPGATISQYFPLNVGPNTINVVVTAQDGVTQKTYTVAVTRAAPPVDNIVYQPVSVESPAQSPQLADDGIMVHQGLSPNGDGIDDFLRIDNITNYPDNRLAIMNRNGMLVYEAKGYDNASKLFDGHSNKNGAMQLPGTYFYELDYTVNGITKHKTGFLVLKY